MIFSWKRFRVSILLLILIYVVHGQWQSAQLREWQRPIRVAVYPVLGDSSAITADYVNQLAQEDFAEISQYFSKHAQQNGLAITPFVLYLRPIVVAPPAMPAEHSALSTLLWTLRLRWFNWRTAEGVADINLYAMYYDPATSKVLKHSTALQKGGVGYIMLFADKHQQGQNNIVLAHELLHAVGASDKYHLQTGYPHYPSGYAAPLQNPLHPQSQAELMGGRMAINEVVAEMPLLLAQTTLGVDTLREINWLRDE